MLIGVFAGLITGAVQLFLLVSFVDSVTAGKVNAKAIIFAFLQMLVPLAGLTLCALFARSALVAMGISLAATLLVGAATVLFIRLNRRNAEKRGDKIR